MANKTKLKCDECGTTDPKDEVVKSEIEWVAWGRNCFDMNWRQEKNYKSLCSDCEQEQYEICSECGARISHTYYGIGYMTYDWEGDSLCPGCAQDEGFEVQCDMQKLEEA